MVLKCKPIDCLLKGRTAMVYVCNGAEM